ncbi:hypothetical protein CLOBL_17630 [Clostridium sp. BL-8]|nr:hypothetical protein CLOBL_17630 [Clostridium sp. BL-8]
MYIEGFELCLQSQDNAEYTIEKEIELRTKAKR